MLDDSGCTIYPYRPIACRAATSVEVASCIDEFENRNLSGSFTVSRTHLKHGFNTRAVLIAACQLKGSESQCYELSGGLAEAIEDSGLVEAWLRGKQAFSSVQTVPLDAELASVVRNIVEYHRDLS